jgi:hypothetical protein
MVLRRDYKKKSDSMLGKKDKDVDVMPEAPKPKPLTSTRKPPFDVAMWNAKAGEREFKSISVTKSWRKKDGTGYDRSVLRIFPSDLDNLIGVLVEAKEDIRRHNEGS